MFSVVNQTEADCVDTEVGGLHCTLTNVYRGNISQVIVTFKNRYSVESEESQKL